jgi:RNA polymerase sigma-70 factor (ECF subfamily)
MAEPGIITQLFIEFDKGNREALDEAFPLVYDELRRLAQSRLRSERDDHTLQPTALVHEAYIRLIEQEKRTWKNRVQFFGLAAEMMRRILVNHAISKNRVKRFGEQTRIALDDAILFARENEVDVVEVDTALNKLAKFDERQARITELKFFGGLTNEQVAEVMEISDSTVKREWRIAKAWLHDQLQSQ